MGNIVVHLLACGMPLIIERMEGVKSAAISWVLPAGAAFDPPDKQGRAAMWGELLMRGAGALDSRGQADAFDKLGAGRSAEVGVQVLRVGGTMLGVSVKDVLSLLTEMVMKPRMDYDAIDPARDLAIASIESVQDDPQERASLLLRERHNPEPLNRSGLGTVEGLNSIEREDLVMGWKACCKPEQAILAIAGDVEAAPVIEHCERLLEGWSGGVSEPMVGKAPARGYAHCEDSSSQVQILLAHDAPSEANPDSLLEKFVISVLSGGMAGRLFTEVREKRGLCYSVSAGYRGDKTFGVVSAYVGTSPERAQESLDVLWQELAKLREPEGAVTPAEFSRAKVGMKSSVVFSGESTGARASSLASDQRRLGRPRSLEEIAKAIDEVTLEKVNDYLRRRETGKLTIQTLGPTALKPPV